MKFIAHEVREIMAQLGFRSIPEMVGRTDILEMRKALAHYKARGLDYSRILYQPDVGPEVGRFAQIPQDHGIQDSLDVTTLVPLAKPALEKGEKVVANLPIKNVNRVVGTILGSHVSKRYGAKGLPEDTIRLNFKGSAGQSFGAFVPKGMTLTLEGDANDYVGKGLSGGRIIIYPPQGSTFVAEQNMIIGNVALYGATSGEAYFRGMAGERFCVRNSGVNTVVESVGDHGCEYMTGGRVVVLGSTGRNFAAGMSGGIAYILDEQGTFHKSCNQQMVALEKLEDPEEIQQVRQLIENHQKYTQSTRAAAVLKNWDATLPKFVKVMPRDYKRVLEAFKRVTAAGLSGDEAIMAAFEENAKDASRVGGG
jgi:glutamate synthase (ferredoxin)